MGKSDYGMGAIQSHVTQNAEAGSTRRAFNELSKGTHELLGLAEPARTSVSRHEVKEREMSKR